MNLIQPLLVASLLLIGGLYLNRFRSRIVDRLVMLLILSTGIVFVCFPALTSRIANTVGVGRGTDLLLYVSLISIGFLLTLFYSKIRVMSQTITHLTRAMALREVRKGGTGEEDRK